MPLQAASRGLGDATRLLQARLPRCLFATLSAAAGHLSWHHPSQQQQQEWQEWQHPRQWSQQSVTGSWAMARRQFSSATGSTPYARILDGRAVAAEWADQLQVEVADLTRQIGRPPGLAVVLVGSRPDSILYVTRKQEAAARAGIACDIHRLPQDVTQEALCARIASLCDSPTVDGVLVQLPLPKHLDEEAVMGGGALDPRKDVDGFHPLNMGRMLMRGRARSFVPATPIGVMELLQRSGLDVCGRSAVVLGDSNVVGTPLSCLLRDRGAAAVTVCHRVSLTEWFEDQEQVQRRRARAMACLPQLPGPGTAGPTSADGANSQSQLDTHRIMGGGEAMLQAAAALGGGQFGSHHLPDITRTADFLVVAVGHPGLVKADWVKPGAVVVDVGINVVPAAASAAGGNSGASGQAATACCEAAAAGGACDAAQSPTAAVAGDRAAGGSGLPPGTYGTSPRYQTSSSLSPACGEGYAVVGDVAFEEVSRVASAITPVPGGVGPMTIAALLSNTLQAARYSAGLLPWW